MPFALRSEVTPVVLVGGTVSFVAAPTPAYGVTDVFSNGIITAPAAGVVLADTGQLPVGAYSVQMLYFLELGSMIIEFQWRDAANAANLIAHRFTSVVGTTTNVDFSTRLDVVNPNERFRVVTILAGGAGEDSQATILAKI